MIFLGNHFTGPYYLLFHKTFDHSEITTIIVSEALIFLIGLVMMDESRILNKSGLTATFISLFVSLLFSHSVK